MIRMLIQGINGLFSLYSILILIRCAMSFIPNIDWRKQPSCFIREVTDPYLEIFRRIIPPIGMLDISPIVALIVLGVIQNVLLILLSALFM